MAGSYLHCVDDDGKLVSPSDLADMLENAGDVYEAVEEMYGMIWYLADHLALSAATRALAVEIAHHNYTEGLAKSPGAVTRER